MPPLNTSKWFYYNHVVLLSELLKILKRACRNIQPVPMDKVFEKGVEIAFVLQKMDVAFLVELVKQLADSPVCQHFFPLRLAYLPEIAVNILTD